jgi:hypothetical protein
MSLGGTPRPSYAERVRERASVLVDTSHGCAEVITWKDPCYKGVKHSKEAIVCMALPLTVDDKCWYHGWVANGSHKGWHFIENEQMVSLESIQKFVEEATATNNERFLGKKVPKALLTAMRGEVKRRTKQRAIDLEAGAVITYQQSSNPYLHPYVIYVFCNVWCYICIEWLPVYILLTLVRVWSRCYHNLAGSPRLAM